MSVRVAPQPCTPPPSARVPCLPSPAAGALTVVAEYDVHVSGHAEPLPVRPDLEVADLVGGLEMPCLVVVLGPEQLVLLEVLLALHEHRHHWVAASVAVHVRHGVEPQPPQPHRRRLCLRHAARLPGLEPPELLFE
eukprot:1720626-Rhodomonas_salina.1